MTHTHTLLLVDTWLSIIIIIIGHTKMFFINQSIWWIEKSDFRVFIFHWKRESKTFYYLTLLSPIYLLNMMIDVIYINRLSFPGLFSFNLDCCFVCVCVIRFDSWSINRNRYPIWISFIYNIYKIGWSDYFFSFIKSIVQ